MKIVKARCGTEIMVDDDIYEHAIKYEWVIDKDGYPKLDFPHHLRMHRAVMGNPKEQVDHIDRNKLNCQRSNLRVATPSQNGANRKRRTGGTSEYKGVYSFTKKYKDKEYLYWGAKVKKDGKTVWQKTFKDEIVAAKAYDEKAKEVHGEYAYLNFPTL